MFSFFKKTKEPAGYIALLNLKDWWVNSFSEAERKHIVDVFQPLGAPKDVLITGDLYHQEDDKPLSLLSSLAGWFNNPKDRVLAHKIILKAEEYVSSTKDILDVHFFYPMKMKIFYADRDNPKSLEEAINACLKQIEVSKRAATAFSKEYKNSPLPLHEGYQQLCIIYEKQSKFEDMIKLAEQAKEEGWGGDWDNRIERAKKKKI